MPLQVGLILAKACPMPWFIYYNDTLILVEIRAFTIDETVRLGIARDVLGGVDRYCLYEGSNEVVIECWRD